MVRLPGWTLATLLLLTGCARYPISEPLREKARRDLTFSMVQADPGAFRGSLVIWGGEVIKLESTGRATMLYVLETPLVKPERPKPAGYSRGRFIVETTRPLDPAIYKTGEKVTVAGTIEGQRTENVGQLPYTYPVLRAQQIALWERRVVAYDYGWGWGPGCDWSWDWDCSWGWWWPGGRIAWNVEWHWVRTY